VAFGAVHVHPKAKPRPQRHITSGATEEIKLDSYRALAVKSGTDVTLFSRRRKFLNRQFPYIVEAAAMIKYKQRASWLTKNNKRGHFKRFKTLTQEKQLRETANQEN
jgi:ATP-dependent DNA ligase